MGCKRVAAWTWWPSQRSLDGEDTVQIEAVLDGGVLLVYCSGRPLMWKRTWGRQFPADANFSRYGQPRVA